LEHFSEADAAGEETEDCVGGDTGNAVGDCPRAITLISSVAAKIDAVLMNSLSSVPSLTHCVNRSSILAAIS